MALAHFWPLLAVLFSLGGALIIGFNQWAKLDGTRLVVWRWAGVAPLTAAAATVLPFPTTWQFYAVAALMGMGLAYADVLLFNASRTHGARLAALYVPLKMLLGFTLWAIFNPISLLPLWLEPWRLPLLMGGFALCGGALAHLRNSDASWRALGAIVPVAILFTLGDIVAKLTLPPASGSLLAISGSAVAFLFTTTTVGALGGILLQGWRAPTGPELIRSALFGVLLMAAITLLLVTLALAPNPGYVAAVTMLSALWLALYARFTRGAQENLWAGLGLLLGAVAVAVGGH
jgi:hypothetical protein